MAEHRGKKGKKTGWQVTLGVKEAVFVGLGVAGLLMMSFALGTLAGRGDIYRVLHNWGLVGPESLKTVQLPAAGVVPVAPALTQPTPGTAAVTPADQAVTAKAPLPAPTQGNLVASPEATPHAKKKTDAKDPKKKDETVAKIKKDVASKLKFLNDQEQAATKAGDKSKSKEKTAAPPGPTLVAKYRDGKQAQAKLAEMRKQGEKVSLKEGRDADGPFFALYRQLPATSTKNPVVAQSQPKNKKTAAKNTNTKTSGR